VEDVVVSNAQVNQVLQQEEAEEDIEE